MSRAQWARALNWLSAYLPLLLMALLALGSYWLVKNTPVPGMERPDAPPQHEPDYFMRKFAIQTFDVNGQIKSLVYGDEARHYPDTDTLEIDNVRIRSFDRQGRLTVASAERAVSSADGSEVQLIGNARVIRDTNRDGSAAAGPSLEFRGEFLHAFLDSERVKSHLPVTLIRGEARFSADTLDYDQQQRAGELRGRVRGSIPADKR